MQMKKMFQIDLRLNVNINCILRFTQGHDNKLPYVLNDRYQFFIIENAYAQFFEKVKQ